VNGSESLDHLSFGLTTGRLAEQERTLARLRTGAGTVLGSASIAGSFLSAKTHDGSLDVWGALALVAFVVCIGSAIWVLLPHTFVFAFGGEALRAEAGRGIRDVKEGYHVAAIWIEPHLVANETKMAGLTTWLTVSCVLLAAEIVLWTFSLVG
jgi:hypothetical protein